MIYDKWPRDHKSALWCVGALKNLSDLGILEPGAFEPTEFGTHLWDQLDKEFKPTDGDIKLFVEHLFSPDQQSGGITLLIHYRDNREKILEFVEGEHESSD